MLELSDKGLTVAMMEMPKGFIGKMDICEQIGKFIREVKTARKSPREILEISSSSNRTYTGYKILHKKDMSSGYMN